MPVYSIKIVPEALRDIQNATDWYNEQLAGLGSRFQKDTIRQISRLKRAPLLYAIRYDKVRCMIIPKFPFMVHFILNDVQKEVTVYAVFHTSRNPEIWKHK